MLLAFSRTFHYQPFFAIYVISFIWLELWIHKHKTIQVVKNCLDTSHPVNNFTSSFFNCHSKNLIMYTDLFCMHVHTSRGGMYVPCAHVNIRGQLESDSSVLLLYWSHGLNTGSETVQAPFPAEPQPHPHSHSSTPPLLHPFTSPPSETFSLFRLLLFHQPVFHCFLLLLTSRV